MKTMKNKLLTVFVLVFAIAFTALTVASFGNDAKRAFADDGTYEIAANTAINFYYSKGEIAGTPSDTLCFEYKLTETVRSVAFVIRNSGGSNIVEQFTLTGTGGLTDTSTSGVDISVESASDGFYKVTITGENIIRNTERIYSRNGAYKSAITIRAIAFGAVPEYTITMAKGASVRKVAPYGIRFKANISEDLFKDESATFGMTIIPYDWIVEYADLLETYENDYIAALEYARENYGLKFVKFSCDPVSGDDGYYIQASLTNIKEKNLTREFIGIAWYEKGGVKKYAYDPDCARSIREVAAKAIIAGEDFNEDQANFVNGIVDLEAYDPDTAKLTYATKSQAVKGEDVLVFYYKKTAAGTVRFAVINNADWNSGFYGYFEIADNNTISAAGVTVEAAGNDWYKVTLDTNSMTVTSGDPSAHTYFDTVYFRSGTATFEVMGLGVEPRPAHADKIAFSAGGSHVRIDAPATAAYTSVSFDYQITSNSGTMALGVFNSDTNGGYGYYDFGLNGITATGITCETLEDGWIHVVIDLTQTTKIFNSNQLSEFACVYVRGKNCTADGYIDNVQWVLPNS